MSEKQRLGSIHREHRVECGGCHEWQHDASGMVGRAVWAFKRSGWKLTHERGWLCPICAELGPRDEREAGRSTKEV